MFWPTLSCQILIIFIFLESRWHKQTDCINFLKIFCKLFVYNPLKDANNPLKEICIFLVLLNYTSCCLKFGKYFCIFEMAWSTAFPKCKSYNILNIFLLTYLLYNWIFISICLSNSRASYLTDDVSFVIFDNQTWDLEAWGGGVKYPIRERVK